MPGSLRVLLAGNSQEYLPGAGRGMNLRPLRAAADYAMAAAPQVPIARENSRVWSMSGLSSSRSNDALRCSATIRAHFGIAGSCFQALSAGVPAQDSM